MGFFKKKITEIKKQYAYEKAAKQQIRKKQKAAYYRAKEKAVIGEAETRAKVESQQRIKAMKQPKKSGSGSGMNKLFDLSENVSRNLDTTLGSGKKKKGINLKELGL